MTSRQGVDEQVARARFGASMLARRRSRISNGLAEAPVTAKRPAHRRVANFAHDVEAHGALRVRRMVMATMGQRRHYVPLTGPIGRDRLQYRNLTPALAHHVLEIDRRAVSAGPVGHVDDEQIGDLSQNQPSIVCTLSPSAAGHDDD